MIIDKKCITSISSYILYKYIFLPLLLFFSGFALLIFLHHSGYGPIGFLISSSIVFAFGAAIFFAFIKIKKIYIDDNGFYYEKSFIPWSMVERLRFNNFSPPVLIIKYKQNESVRRIASILPIHDYNNTKTTINTYFRSHN